MRMKIETARNLPPQSSSIERLVVVHMTILLIASTWANVARYPWMSYCFAVLGIVGVFLAIYHLCVVEQCKRKEIIRYCIFLIPPLLLFGITLIGSFAPAFSLQSHNGSTYLALNNIDPSIPNIARPDQIWAWTLIYIAIYIGAINPYFILRSRRIIRALFSVAVVNASILCLYGMIKSINFRFNPPPNFYYNSGTIPPFEKVNSFVPFCSFHTLGEWIAFALLWISVCVAFRLNLQRIINVGSIRIWVTPRKSATWIGLLLGSSLLLWSTPKGMLALGCLGTLTLVQFICTSYSRGKKKLSLYLKLVTASTAAILILGLSLQYAYSTMSNEYSFTLKVWQDADRCLKISPYFGWGINSFSSVFPFFAQNDIAQYEFAHPSSSLIKILLEMGIVGSLLISIIPIILFIRYVFTRQSNSYGNYIVMALLTILLFSLIETTFSNLGVVMSFSILMLCSVKYGEIHKEKKSP